MTATTDAPACSVVIPTLNERENIPEIVARVEALFPPGSLEIIVVDERSPDGTLDAALALAAAGRPWLRAFPNPGARGLSPSVVAGFDAARSRVLACMDGDMQHEESKLPLLVEAVQAGADMAIGTRHAAGGRIMGGWSLGRRLASRLAGAAARAALGARTSDPMSGFFALSREAYGEIRPHLRPSGYKIMLEALAILTALRPGCRVVEVGIAFRPRTRGKSKMDARVLAQFAAMLLTLRRRAASLRGGAARPSA